MRLSLSIECHLLSGRTLFEGLLSIIRCFQTKAGRKERGYEKSFLRINLVGGDHHSDGFISPSASRWIQRSEMGTEFSTVESEMEYRQTAKDGINYYRKLGDEMKIGKAELIELHYGFRENKFCSVLITVKGQLNFTWLRDTTFERFGPPTNRERENLQNKYLWLSDPNGKIELAWIPPIGFGVMRIASKHFAEPEAGF
jgi:hypothetical protein